MTTPSDNTLAKKVGEFIDADLDVTELLRAGGLPEGFVDLVQAFAANGERAFAQQLIRKSVKFWPTLRRADTLRTPKPPPGATGVSPPKETFAALMTPAIADVLSAVYLRERGEHHPRDAFGTAWGEATAFAEQLNKVTKS